LIPYYIKYLPFSIQKNHPHSFDENGVIMSRIPYGARMYYHATNIASYAIYKFNPNETTETETQLKWLEDNMDKDGAIWHTFKLPYYDFPNKWVGGLAQGLTISAFIRAYHKYHDEKYLQLAEKAFNAMVKYCIVKDEAGLLWIKEYPNVNTILNGFIFSLFGCYDIIRDTEDAKTRIKAKYIWKEGIITLLATIHLYNSNGWSLYDLKNSFYADEFYHRIHIEQMRALASLSKYKLFKTYEIIWKMNLNKPLKKQIVNLEKKLQVINQKGLLTTIKNYQRRRRWMKSAT